MTFFMLLAIWTVVIVNFFAVMGTIYQLVTNGFSFANLFSLIMFSIVFSVFLTIGLTGSFSI